MLSGSINEGSGQGHYSTCSNESSGELGSHGPRYGTSSYSHNANGESQQLSTTEQTLIFTDCLLIDFDEPALRSVLVTLLFFRHCH